MGSDDLDQSTNTDDLGQFPSTNTDLVMIQVSGREVMI